jgi:hypothetical protein
LQVELKVGKYLGVSGFAKMMAGDYPGEPPLSLDVAPLYDNKISPNTIRRTMASWQRDTGTTLSDADASKIRRSFERKDSLSLLTNYSEQYDGQFYRADDFVQAVVRMYLFETRRKAMGTQKSELSVRPSELRKVAYGQTSPAKTPKFSDTVFEFLTNLRDRYLLKTGWLEFDSCRDHPMGVWDGENLLGKTSDEFGFSEGIHNIKVEGIGGKCTWDLDVIPGLLPARWCPEIPSDGRPHCPAISPSP